MMVDAMMMMLILLPNEGIRNIVIFTFERREKENQTVRSSVINKKIQSERFIKFYKNPCCFAQLTLFNSTPMHLLRYQLLLIPFAAAVYPVTRHANLTNPLLDVSDQGTLIYYPSSITEKEETFPLLVYAHGAAGGNYDINGYDLLFRQMAEHGFIVIAHRSCNSGCRDTTPSEWTTCAGIASLPPLASKVWDVYYGESLKMIEWAKGSAEKFAAKINWSLGVGIVGHSMGGQSTTIAANRECAKKYDIRAAVLHHPESCATEEEYGNAGSNIDIPLAAFTSSGDGVCPASDTFDIFNATHGIRAFRNLEGNSHLEPVLANTKDLARLTAAWFDIYINGEGGETYEESQGMIFGTGDDSICKYATMVECVVDDRTKEEEPLFA